MPAYQALTFNLECGNQGCKETGGRTGPVQAKKEDQEAQIQAQQADVSQGPEGKILTQSPITYPYRRAKELAWRKARVSCCQIWIS